MHEYKNRSELDDDTLNKLNRCIQKRERVAKAMPDLHYAIRAISGAYRSGKSVGSELSRLQRAEAALQSAMDEWCSA